MLEKTVRDKYRKITKTLIAKQLSITTMESCTSGQIASLITDTEGSSAVMKGAYITYSNEAKVKCGVPESIIAEHGVYSEETARAMAETARKAYSADIAIGVTGTMGNVDPANNDSTPGEVFFALSSEMNGTQSFQIKVDPQPDRYSYKLAVADAVADQVIALLDGI